MIDVRDIAEMESDGKQDGIEDSVLRVVREVGAGKQIVTIEEIFELITEDEGPGDRRAEQIHFVAEQASDQYRDAGGYSCLMSR